MFNVKSNDLSGIWMFVWIHHNFICIRNWFATFGTSATMIREFIVTSNINIWKLWKAFLNEIYISLSINGNEILERWYHDEEEKIYFYLLKQFSEKTNFNLNAKFTANKQWNFIMVIFPLILSFKLKVFLFFSF